MKDFRYFLGLYIVCLIVIMVTPFPPMFVDVFFIMSVAVSIVFLLKHFVPKES